MKIKISLLFICLILIFLSVRWWFFSFDFRELALTVDAPTGTFSILKTLPEARTEAGGTTLDEQFYIFGGINAWGKTLASAYRYSVSDSSWKKIKDLPEPINHAGVIHDKENIYLVGGFKPLSIRIRGFMFADWNALNTIYRYTPSKNKWVKLKSMPQARGAGGVCVVNDTIWYVGGIDQNKNISNSLFGYSIKSDQWFSRTPMKYPRDHLRAETVNGKIYAISGRKDDLRFNLPFVEEYNPNTRTWRRMADIPVARGGFGSSVYNGKIYTYGGESTWSTFESFEVFDPSSNIWQKLQPLPESRHGIVSGWIDNRLHLVSGGRHPRLSISGIHRVFTIKQTDQK